MFKILPRMKSAEGRIGDLSWHLPRVISETDWQPGELESIRDGLDELISEDFRWEETWPHYFSSTSHLSGLLAAACLRGLKGEVTTKLLRASVKSLLLRNHHDPHKEVFPELTKALNSLPADQSCKLFWETDAFLQSLQSRSLPWERFSATRLRWTIQIDQERDLDWIHQSLSDINRSNDERAVVLEAALRLGRGGDELSRRTIELKEIVKDLPELSDRIDEWSIKATAHTEPEEWEIEQEKWDRESKEQEARDLASWQEFWKSVSEDPDNAFSDKKAGNTAWNLWHAMSRAGSRGRESGWNRQFIEQFLGKEVADRLRKTLMSEWRKYLPSLKSERPEDAKGTYLVIWELGLAGIYAESEDPEWAKKLSGEEARLAARYAMIELNSLPSWMEALVKEHAAEAEGVLGDELVEELSEKTAAHFHSMLLQNIGHSSDVVISIFLPRIRAWLDARPSHLPETEIEKGEIDRLRQVTEFLAKHGDVEMISHLCETARKQVGSDLVSPFSRVWLPLLIQLDAAAGVDALARRVESVSPSQRSEAVLLIGALFGDRREGIGITKSNFTPKILLQLMRLIYQHVRPEDDVPHVGAYSPDERDNAEQGRNNIVNALLSSKGEDGWAIKLEMAADPLCAHFKDRIVAMAEEGWAEEIDADAFNDQQAVELDKTGEAPPATNEAMFSMMVDRLCDLDEILLLPDSPREAWAGITQERIMRREIARTLSNLSNGKYKIDQEAVTADEKETDIRLSSKVSEHVAVIELKLANTGRTAKDLLASLEEQLVKKYMASETSRSGCLLITLATEREWEYPDKASKISFPQLVELLRTEAERIASSLGGALRLHVHALDLRPRLPTESAKKK